MKIKTVFRKSGSTVLVVLLVLTVITTYIAANSRTLFHLKKELDLIEREQLKKFTARQGSAAKTAQAPTAEKVKP